MQSYGFIAQLVEQETENPCVPGSIPGEGTKQKSEQKITKFSVTSKKISKKFEIGVVFSRLLLFHSL